ncbi:hypothetical protein ACSFC1_00670 [Pseudothermotoga sp. U03pept]|uniref:hypothetical protein n=1 Tax=Pseudothermotoga sp. U03pept TaxID=3447012 RepID=UPI003F0928F9
MERINLYRRKKQVLKLSSFLVLLAALISPVIAVRFTTEFYKQSVMNSLRSQHSYVLQKYQITLKTSQLKDQLNNIITRNQSLYTQSKRLQDRIDVLETHLTSYENGSNHIKELLNLWGNKSDDWMMLSQISLDNQLILTFFELYTPEKESRAERIFQKLAELGYKVSKIVDYDTSMSFLSMRLTKITLQGGR